MIENIAFHGIGGIVQNWVGRSQNTTNNLLTSKNETTNSTIHEFKVLYKGQSAF